jgi:hypothetical protein
MKLIPATLQTSYANLLEAHLNRPSFEFDGAPFVRKLNNKAYWYANQRSAPGASAKQRYLGPDTEEMRARIEAMREQQQNAAEFRTHTSSLVAQLRAGGIQGPDRKVGPILRAMANSGVFRLGGTLVGTHAYRHYDLVLGVHLSDGTEWTTQTEDIDIAGFEKLSMAIEDSADPDLADGLTRLGFRPRPTVGRKPSTSWILSDASYAIDFLTPSFNDDEKPVQLHALKMWAQSLHFMNYLIAEPIDAVSPYMEGLLIKIPRPERYAVHKLIIAQRRKGTRAKAKKDIEQARTLIWAMTEDQPYVIHNAIAEADAMGPAWRKALDQALDIKFEAAKTIQNMDRDVIRLSGTVLGETRPRLFEISGEALDDHFDADRNGLHERHEPANRNRSEIETIMRWKFRHQPSHSTLVTTEDVVRWRKEARRLRP